MVTHNPELTEHATRLIYLKDGQIMHDQKLAPGEMVNLSNISAANEYENEVNALKKKAKLKAKPKPRKRQVKKPVKKPIKKSQPKKESKKK